MAPALTQALWRAIGVGILVLPLLAIPRWVGAPDRGPDWGMHAWAWLIGILVVTVAGALVGRLARTVQWRAPEWPAWGDTVLVGGLAVLLTGAAAYTMRVAFAANPHLIDEVAQLFQARVFSSGSVAAPAPQPPEFFLFANTWITGAGWVSQFPPAHSIALAIGMVLRAEWLVNPLLGGGGVVLVYVTTRGMFDAPTARIAAFLWAASAWVLFMSATYMNHALSVTLVLGAWACVFAPAPGVRHYLGAGLLLGAALATRPLDAVAGALPLLVYLGLARRPRAVAGLAVGGLPLVLALGYYNWRLFGGPLDLGYTLLWGEAHQLGFHLDPWGRPYTPLIGLANVVSAIRRLHIYLFEWPVPALLLLGMWAVLARRRELNDLPLALGVVAGPALYFLYWHSGFYPGPRFYYIAAPFLIIATARAVRWLWLAARGHPDPRIRWDAAVVGASVLVLAWGWVDLLPRRFRVYQTGLPAALKQHPERALARAGVDRALVLVPESWGARIITDLWALGAPPGLVERVYHRLDACELHLLAMQARSEQLPAEAVIARLERRYAAADAQAPLVGGSRDPTLRLWPTRQLAAECVAELEHDRAGFTLYGNLAWRNPVGLHSGIVFARDRNERNPLLLGRYAGWEVWRFAPPVGDPDGVPTLSRLGRAEELLEPAELP